MGDLHDRPVEGRRRAGARWTFEEFCRVFCRPQSTSASLAEELGRSVGAIEAIRASIEAVSSGTHTPTFPGPKWVEFVRRARADKGKCP